MEVTAVDEEIDVVDGKRGDERRPDASHGEKRGNECHFCDVILEPSGACSVEEKKKKIVKIF